MNFRDLQLHCLALSRRFNQSARCGDAAAGRDLLKGFFGNYAGVDHKLHAFEARTVVEFDECRAL